jgi:hypothetical protein
MNTVINFTREELDRNLNWFFADYFTVHSDGNNDEANVLYRIFAGVLIEYRTLLNGYKSSLRTGVDFSPSLKEKQIYCLFYNMDFMDLASQFRAFVIEKNDISLNAENYILLFYVSLQDEEVQKVTQHLPLNMLHDMLMPVAEENLREWMLNS